MIFSKGEPLKKVPTDRLVDELFAEIDKFYAAGKRVVRDETAAAEAARWLVGERGRHRPDAGAPGRPGGRGRAPRRRRPAAPAIDDEASPVAGRRFQRA